MNDTLEAARHALIAVHKHLVALVRADYTREHGAAPTPQALLHHLTTDDGAAWLRPLSALIVAADELLEDTLTREVVSAWRAEVEAALRADPVFAARYRDAMQTEPDLVVEHGALLRTLAALPRVG